MDNSTSKGSLGSTEIPGQERDYLVERDRSLLFHQCMSVHVNDFCRAGSTLHVDLDTIGGMCMYVCWLVFQSLIYNRQLLALSSHLNGYTTGRKDFKYKCC